MAESLLTPAQLALLEETDGLRPASAEALALRALGGELRDALSGEIDVADDVMLAIALNDAVGGGVDVADDVMLAIALNDAVGGGVDVADDVMLAIALNDAVGGGVDVADDVMLAIALNDAVGGGIDVADDVMLAIALNDAVGGGVDVADDVMAEINPVAEIVQLRPAARTATPVLASRWSAAGGISVVFAMAAAVLFSIANTPRAYQPVEIAAEVKPESIQVASFNEAEIEDLNTPDNATVTVMQFDEGGPTIILVSDSEG